MRWFISLPIIGLVVARAFRRKSLTPVGCGTAAITAYVHSLHPSAIPFTLLLTFFLLGTNATKVKHEIKAGFTLSSSGHSGGEGPRTSIQVLANSGAATALCLAHVLKFGLGTRLPCFAAVGGIGSSKDEILSSIILVGIIANYASVAADTLSSELGILSKSEPVLVTKIWKKVPKGTNGGITIEGVLWGALGSAIISAVGVTMLPFCGMEDGLAGWAKETLGMARANANWDARSKAILFGALSLCGAAGSLLDSILGAVLQASVVDRRTGKVVEGPGGVKVLTHGKVLSPNKRGKQQESRLVNTGSDILDNNQINFLMASSMTVLAMAIAGASYKAY